MKKRTFKKIIFWLFSPIIWLMAYMLYARYWIKRMQIFMLIALCMILGACASPTPAPTLEEVAKTNPGLAASYAQATNQASLSIAGAQLTLSAATQVQEIYNQQSAATAAAASATAYAPFAQATQAAIDLQIQKMYGDATSTSAAATQTANAEQQAYNAQATNASGAVTQIAAVTQQAFIVQKNKDDAAANTNQFWALAWPILFVTLILSIAFAGLQYARSQRRKPIERDQYGKTQPIMDNVTGDYIDLSASPNYAHINRSLLEQLFIQWLMKNHGFTPNFPQITAERQDMVKEREQIIEFHRMTRKSLPKTLIEAQSILPEANVDEDQFDTFPLPDWNIFTQYRFEQGGAFPFGSYKTELARIDLNEYPHVGLIGPSGIGKSRLFLRPFIASSLASGNRVIILGDMVDFVVFKAHPNATLVPIWEITKPEDATQYVEALQAINAEMERRLRILTEAGESTWSRQGGENTLIVLDELGPNLDILDDTNAAAARALRGFLTILINKGRKAGFNFIFSGTRAVGLKKQLSQVSTIAFRLKDTDEERYTFGQSGFGANHTPKNYYLTKIGSDIQMTGSFNPSDEQLMEFIFSHQTKALPKPEWIEGAFSNVALPIQPEQKKLSVVSTPSPAAPILSTANFVNNLSEWEAHALDLYVSGLDQEHIVSVVFAGDDPAIGRVAVADVIKRYRANVDANAQLPIHQAPAASITQEANNTEAEIEALRKQNEAEEQRKRADEEMKIRLYHEQGFTNSDIVAKVWGTNGAKFKERMARVKDVLSTSSSELPNGKSTEMPINDALPA